MIAQNLDQTVCRPHFPHVPHDIPIKKGGSSPQISPKPGLAAPTGECMFMVRRPIHKDPGSKATLIRSTMVVGLLVKMVGSLSHHRSLHCLLTVAPFSGRWWIKKMGTHKLITNRYWLRHESSILINHRIIVMSFENRSLAPKYLPRSKSRARSIWLTQGSQWWGRHTVPHAKLFFLGKMMMNDWIFGVHFQIKRHASSLDVGYRTHDSLFDRSIFVTLSSMGYKYVHALSWDYKDSRWLKYVLQNCDHQPSTFIKHDPALPCSRS